MREIEGATVDIFEKDLLPYGLIRHGVAPDHQSMKKVVNDMNLVGKQPGIRLLGGAKVVRADDEGDRCAHRLPD